MAMKQNNFYLRWQKAAGAAKTESRSKDLRAVVPGIAVVAVCMAGWGVMVLHTSMLKSRRQNILNWCADNSATYLSSTLDAEEAAEFRRGSAAPGRCRAAICAVLRCRLPLVRGLRHDK